MGLVGETHHFFRKPPYCIMLNCYMTKNDSNGIDHNFGVTKKKNHNFFFLFKRIFEWGSIYF